MTESFPLGVKPGAPRPIPRVGWRVALGLLASIALVAAGVAGAVLLPGNRPPDPDRWDPRLVELVEFVEAERGLTFGAHGNPTRPDADPRALAVWPFAQSRLWSQMSGEIKA